MVLKKLKLKLNVYVISRVGTWQLKLADCHNVFWVSLDGFPNIVFPFSSNCTDWSSCTFKHLVKNGTIF